MGWEWCAGKEGLLLSFFFKSGGQKKFEILYQSLPPHFTFLLIWVPKETQFLISNEQSWILRLPNFSIKLSMRLVMRTFLTHVRVSQPWDDSTRITIWGHLSACLGRAAGSSRAPLSRAAVLCPQACCPIRPREARLLWTTSRCLMGSHHPHDKKSRWWFLLPSRLCIWSLWKSLLT